MRRRSSLRLSTRRWLLLSVATLLLVCKVHAGPIPPTGSAEKRVEKSGETEQSWAAFAQLTNVTQWHGSFRSPYSGTNSLAADGPAEETTDATLYAGSRLWRGAEFWVNPEIDQGFGLSGTLGVAGFPSGEAYEFAPRIGTLISTIRSACSVIPSRLAEYSPSCMTTGCMTWPVSSS
jgi:high affinity Mn2+ porin